MRIGVIGPGALGCLFSTKLFFAADKKDSVLLIDHRAERAGQLNEQGILCESDGKTEQIPVPVSSSPEQVGPLDVLFSCVKSHGLKNSLSFAAPLLSPSTLLIFMQNGISHLHYEDSEELQAVPVFATSSEGATLLAPGHIRHAGSGHTWLGFLSPGSRKENERLEKVAVLLQQAGIASSVSDDIRSRIWAKLFVNVGINALTAIHNQPNGWLLTSSAPGDTVDKLVREAEEVARAAGITINEDPVATTRDICRRTADNISSMLQDVRNRRPTEIDAINGAVSHLGRELGVATPVNDAIIAQIKAIERGYTEQQ